MKHNKAKKLLIQFFSGDLPANIKKELEIHLQDCGECRDEIRLLEEIISKIKSKHYVEQSHERFERTKLLAWKEYRKKKDFKKEETIPFLLPFAFMGFLLFLLSNILVFNLVSKGITPLNFLISISILGYQFAGILFFVFIIFLKKDYSVPDWLRRSQKEINQCVERGG